MLQRWVVEYVELFIVEWFNSLQNLFSGRIIKLIKEYSSEEGKCVLDIYKWLIYNGNKLFLFERDVFQKWSAVKISILAMMMFKVVFYKFLLQEKFIVTDNVTCPLCQGN